MKILRYICLLATAVFLLFSAGCWNRREPESLALVMAIGIGYDQKSKQYEVVVDLANPTALAGGGGDNGGGGGQGKGSIVASARGRNVFEAMRQIEPQVSRDLFWGHCEEVIITEDLARRGIQPVLDLYSRERQTRLSNFLLITDDDPKELLQVKLPLETEVGVGIRRQIQTVQQTQTVIPFTDVRMVLIDLERPGKEIFVPRIRLKKGEKGQEEGGAGAENSPSESNSSSEKGIEVAGGAVFRGDRMAGWMEPEAAQGWLYIMGNISRATEMIPCSDPDCERYLAVEVHRVFSRAEATMKEGKPKIKVKIAVEGRLQEKDCPDSYTREYEEALHKVLAEGVRKKALTAINRAQELRSDIFGFGNAIYRRYPREWGQLEESWEKKFSRLVVEVEAKADILRPGLVEDPPESP